MLEVSGTKVISYQEEQINHQSLSALAYRRYKSGGRWISRIRVDQTAAVLKILLFGLIHGSGHTRLACKSVGPRFSPLHWHSDLWSAGGFGGWKEEGSCYFCWMYQLCLRSFLNKCPWPLLVFIPVFFVPLLCHHRGLDLDWLTNGYNAVGSKGFWATSELLSKLFWCSLAWD